MEGNVVTAAKWLGSSMVLASLILVGGLRWALGSLDRNQPVAATATATAPKTPPDGPTMMPIGGSADGELEALAKSFHGNLSASAPGAGEGRSWFTEPPASGEKGTPRPAARP